MEVNKGDRKYKILFVCLGNICRSPSANGIMEHLVEAKNLSNFYEVDSAGTYAGHKGDLPDKRMRAHAIRRGYDLTHRARPVCIEDFERFDLIIAMDDRNYYDLYELAPDLESRRKIHRMVEYSINPTYDYVPDPYYSGADGFELVLDLLEDACRGLIDSLEKKRINGVLFD
ncbi:MAG: low molecular weight protein-tyrosine-phosphatase [Bacteroidales bacterium]|nr:low molecular weight protein-tyrosine-phosphatase [Bacteroidales bacterium]